MNGTGWPESKWEKPKHTPLKPKKKRTKIDVPMKILKDKIKRRKEMVIEWKKK